MSSGYIACNVVTISNEGLEKICPETFRAFWNFLDENELDLRSVSDVLNDNDRTLLTTDYEEIENEEEECIETLLNLWNALAEDFQSKTSTLSLYADFHCIDDGDKYDDIDGFYFGVGNVYVKSEDAKKIETYLSDASFVVYG